MSINSLPVELLAYIFSLLHPSNLYTTIPAVCQLFRAVCKEMVLDIDDRNSDWIVSGMRLKALSHRFHGVRRLLLPYLVQPCYRKRFTRQTLLQFVSVNRNLISINIANFNKNLINFETTSGDLLHLLSRQHATGTRREPRGDNSDIEYIVEHFPYIKRLHIWSGRGLPHLVSSIGNLYIFHTR